MTRKPGLTSEGTTVSAWEISEHSLDNIRNAMGGYFENIEKFIDDMNKIFEFGDDYGIYIPEIKYAAEEPLVNYNDLSLNDYPNIHFVGDALSARGISVSGAQAIYVAESILKEK
jgi:uncharacterized FAD-dependent dehydrogenase